MGTLTKLTSGGQITLPKEIRTKTNMKPGDFVEVRLMARFQSYSGGPLRPYLAFLGSGGLGQA
ncbi:MAG: AbrB/MazE/SpoVT family DNA-binding domain-containing protein [Dehalococcoidia bacterium]|nr:AbrB/MazE/SpoVT family DNA-binding domain-containing protein [Dehalococcoidia bacterium]